MHAALETKKPANGKEEEKSGPKSFKRPVSHPLTFKPPNEATEGNLIKPMRRDGVEEERYLNEL